MKLLNKPTAQDIEDWAMEFEQAVYTCNWPDTDTTDAKRLVKEFRKQAQFIAECIAKAYP